jgi:hypothetical protein
LFLIDIVLGEPPQKNRAYFVCAVFFVPSRVAGLQCLQPFGLLRTARPSGARPYTRSRARFARLVAQKTVAN